MLLVVSTLIKGTLHVRQRGSQSVPFQPRQNLMTPFRVRLSRSRVPAVFYMSDLLQNQDFVFSGKESPCGIYPHWTGLIALSVRTAGLFLQRFTKLISYP